MKCKYPNKFCGDRYRSERKGLCCRLLEWKRRLRSCPHDPTIVSKPLRKLIDANKNLQTFK